MSGVELDCLGYALECKRIGEGEEMWRRIHWVGDNGKFPSADLAAEALHEFIFPKSELFTHRIVMLEKRVLWYEA